jgi:hypothetical protein
MPLRHAETIWHKAPSTKLTLCLNSHCDLVLTLAKTAVGDADVRFHHDLSACMTRQAQSRGYQLEPCHHLGGACTTAGLPLAMLLDNPYIPPMLWRFVPQFPLQLPCFLQFPPGVHGMVGQLNKDLRCCSPDDGLGPSALKPTLQPCRQDNDGWSLQWALLPGWGQLRF